MFVKAIDPTTQDVLGGVDSYPGMMPTRAMQPDALYAVPVRFHLDKSPALPLRVDLVFGWRVPDPDDPGQGEYVPMTDAAGRDLPILIAPGPTVAVDPTLPPPDYPASTDFGGIIRLDGVSLSPTALAPGEPFDVTLYWRSLAATPEDWTVTVGLLDADGHLAAQNDGMPPGFPTSAWYPGARLTDRRTLTAPDTPGDYQLFVGWYRAADLTRLSASGGRIENDLWLLPQPITVR
jgi:hypothetical protein